MPFGVVSGVGREKSVGVEIVEEEWDSFGGKCGHPIVTDGDFVAQLFSVVRSGDAALPKLLWGFLFQVPSRGRIAWRRDASVSRLLKAGSVSSYSSLRFVLLHVCGDDGNPTGSAGIPWDERCSVAG